jgi:D-tyrosyl-tRNA(Tyr) deacylase
LIQECVDKGYTVAKHGPLCFKEDELYVYVGGSEGDYIKTYGGEVIASPTA